MDPDTGGDKDTDNDHNADNGADRGHFRHLVISGGGVGGVILYGALRTLCADGCVDMERIESVDAVSAGALIAVMFLLGYDLEYLDDYVVKRPWARAFPTEQFDPVSVVSKKGIFDASRVVEVVRPLLEARDLSPDITLRDFREHTGKRLFMYTVDLNRFPIKTVQLSSDSHPDLALSLALQMTCCYPVIFAPVIYGSGCYIDGGIATKCPVTQCMARLRTEGAGDGRDDPEDDVVVVTCESSPEHGRVGHSTSMVEYVRHMVDQMNHAVVTSNDYTEVRHTVRCFNADTDTFDAWYKCIHSEPKRLEYVHAGARFARMYTRATGYWSGRSERPS